MPAKLPYLPDPKPGEVLVLNQYGVIIGYGTPERVQRFHEVHNLLLNAWNESRPAPTREEHNQDVQVGRFQ